MDSKTFPEDVLVFYLIRHAHPVLAEIPAPDDVNGVGFPRNASPNWMVICHDQS